MFGLQLFWREEYNDSIKTRFYLISFKHDIFRNIFNAQMCTYGPLWC